MKISWNSKRPSGASPIHFLRVSGYTTLVKERPKILVIVGPTASGKSALAVRLAQRFGGEIVSADSRQVYRGMNIGTGKITKDEMGGIRHHLLDVASPKGVFTVADYAPKAAHAIRGILRRGKLPIICGGTGFYISALVDGLTLPDVPPDPALRERLRKKSVDDLFARLARLDPDFAARIDRKNPHRLIRAIEIARALGRVPPLHPHMPYDPLFIGITWPKTTLARRIEKRLIARVRAGMVDEVRRLMKYGVTHERLDALGLEYRYVSRHLRAELSKDALLAELGSAIRNYAKRQMTWFKKDKRIHWVGTQPKKTERLVAKFLGK